MKFAQCTECPPRGFCFACQNEGVVPVLEFEPITWPEHVLTHDNRLDRYSAEASTLELEPGEPAPEVIAIRDCHRSRLFELTGDDRRATPDGIEVLGWRYHEVNGSAAVLIIND